VIETIPLEEDYDPCICIIEVEYDEGESERYALPSASRSATTRGRRGERAPNACSAELAIEKKSGRVEGSSVTRWPTQCGRLLLDVFDKRRRLKGESGRDGHLRHAGL